MSIHMSARKSFIHMPVHMPVLMPVLMSVHVPVRMPVPVPVHMSVHMSVRKSVRMSTHRPSAEAILQRRTILHQYHWRPSTKAHYQLLLFNAITKMLDVRTHMFRCNNSYSSFDAMTHIFRCNNSYISMQYFMYLFDAITHIVRSMQ